MFPAVPQEWFVAAICSVCLVAGGITSADEIAYERADNLPAEVNIRHLHFRPGTTELFALVEQNVPNGGRGRGLIQVIRNWNLASREPGAVIQGVRCGGMPWSTMAFSDNGARVAVLTSPKVLRVWNHDLTEIVRTFEMKGYSTEPSLSISRDGRRVVAVDDTVHMFHVERGLMFPVEGPTFVDFATLASEDRRVVAVDSETNVHVFDTARLRKIRTFSLLENADDPPADCFAAVARSKFLVVGRVDGHLEIWDHEVGQRVATLRGHKRRITDLDVSSDGKWMVSADDEGQMFVWDLVARRKLASVSVDVHVDFLNIAMSDDRQWLAASNISLPHVILWKLVPEDPGAEPDHE